MGRSRGLLTFATAQDEVLCRATKAVTDDVTTLALSFELANQATFVDVDHVNFALSNIDNNYRAVTARGYTCDFR